MKENKIYKDQLIIYFKSISGLMSSELRKLIIGSIHQYYLFIKQFKHEKYLTAKEIFDSQFDPATIFQKSFIEVELKEHPSGEKFTFSDELEDLHTTLTNVIKDIIECSKGVERPDNMFIKKEEEKKEEEKKVEEPKEEEKKVEEPKVEEKKVEEKKEEEKKVEEKKEEETKQEEKKTNILINSIDDKVSDSKAKNHNKQNSKVDFKEQKDDSIEQKGDVLLLNKVNNSKEVLSNHKIENEFIKSYIKRNDEFYEEFAKKINELILNFPKEEKQKKKRKRK